MESVLEPGHEKVCSSRLTSVSLFFLRANRRVVPCYAARIQDKPSAAKEIAEMDLSMGMLQSGRIAASATRLSSLARRDDNRLHRSFARALIYGAK
jgi:hypothetical protein